jgi:hypothetical protein
MASCKLVFMLSLMVTLSLSSIDMSLAARQLLDTPAAPPPALTLPTIPSLPKATLPPLPSVPTRAGPQNYEAWGGAKKLGLLSLKKKSIENLFYMQFPLQNY